jgi:hypothetical protein
MAGDRELVLARTRLLSFLREKRHRGDGGRLVKGHRLPLHPSRSRCSQRLDGNSRRLGTDFQNTSYLEIDTDILTVEVSGDLAYVVLIENVLQISNSQRLEAQSMATNVFERMGDRWYLVHHHGSPVVN